MIKYFSLALVVLILSGCSTGTFSFYEKGDHFSRSFLNIIPNKDKISGEYYEVERNQKKQIVSAKHYSRNGEVIEKSYYDYDGHGVLQRHHYIEYFDIGVPRRSKEWIYKSGRIVQREEQWYTRLRTLEKKLTVFYDDQQKPYLEQTWGLGDRIESSTEYYYDYKNRLDKSRRNFFLLEGGLRDYWLTIYNDEIQIMTEEHYFPNNSLITFYRYGYHPVKSYREREEILDADRDVFITRIFDEYGLVLIEEEKDREMALKSRKVYEYTENHQPKLIHLYDSNAQLVETIKYKKPQYLEGFRTPGIQE